MRIVEWNIQHGGGAWTKGGGEGRGQKVARQLLSYDADILVLNEYMAEASAPLIAHLGDRGYPHVFIPSEPSRRGGVAVLSRVEVERASLPSALADPNVERHVIRVRVPSLDCTLWAAYGPIRDYAYREFWEGLTVELGGDLNGRWLLLGDLNAGERGVDTPDSPLFSHEHFGELMSLGVVDLWRHRHGSDTREFTWEATRGDRAFRYRIDHAIGSPEMVPHITDCHYDHGPRERRLSDHSALVVELR